jgi:WXXGXW repeat (2 copies)
MKTGIKNWMNQPIVRALLLTLLTFGSTSASFAAVFVSVDIAPPPLPVYAQPIAPGPGYIWAPGYWAYGDYGFYWVPGTWVLIPFVGALWTPGYWGWDDGRCIWHAGYWGRHVGFYGGIDYGFGYSGEGYQGGRWNNGTFVYNTAVNNINRSYVRNTYYQPVQNTNATRASYNGGVGGVTAQPTAEDRLAERDQHRPATPAQMQHEQAARANKAQLASVNHGTPATTVTAHPAVIKEHAAVAAKRPANAHHAPATTMAAHPAVVKEHAAVAAKRPASAHHAPATTMAARPAVVKEHAAVAAKRPASAYRASAATAMNEHARSGPQQPARSTGFANGPAPGNANPHLAALHASNTGPRPSVAAPHVQSETHGRSLPAGGEHPGH